MEFVWTLCWFFFGNSRFPMEISLECVFYGDFLICCCAVFFVSFCQHAVVSQWGRSCVGYLLYILHGVSLPTVASNGDFLAPFLPPPPLFPAGRLCFCPTAVLLWGFLVDVFLRGVQSTGRFPMGIWFLASVVAAVGRRSLAT
jgi:hypothetical protein